MAEGRTALIIGAGIGGIATALYLSKNGYVVNVYEKNSAPGGRCSQIIREGHRFDLGATMLVMPGIYRSVFKSLGLDMDKSLSPIPLKDLYRIYFDDGSILVFTPEREKMKEELEKIEPGSYIKSEDYVSKGYRIYKLSLRDLIDRNFFNILDFLSPKMLPLLLRIKAFTPHFKYAMRFFRHPHLLMAYTFQNIYVGQSPFDSPALFSMVPAVELTEGSYFPSQDGLFSVVRKLTEAAGNSGVQFHFDNAVGKIITRGNRAEGVILQNGSEIKADIVVANADLPYVFRELLPDRRSSLNLEKLRYSCSAICFHWGMKKTFPELGQHNVFLSDDFKTGLDMIFKQKSVSEDPSFYIHAPARTDPVAAPPGHDTISAVVAAGHLDKEFNQDWKALKERTRDAIIRRLRKLGLEDFEDNIKFEICFTPEDWETVCNISRGSVFGSLGHNIFQMGYFRPHNRHDKYKNLYFAGGSTHPGNGIPNVLISAKLVSERILKENMH